LFYLATISIASNIVFPIGTTMSERFAFMPSIGFSWVIAVLMYRWGEMRNGKEKQLGIKKLSLRLMVIGVIALLFSIKTISRNTVWKDNYTLFSTDINTSLNSAKLRNAAAGETIAKATTLKNASQQQQMYLTAEQHLQEAIKIHPNYKNAYLQLGNVSNYLNRYEASVQYYNQALQIDPNYQDAINNLGITYRDAGRYYGEEQQDLANSLKYLTLAYQYRPQEYETVRLLGIAYAMSGNTPKAIEFFQKAVDLQPQNADALYNLGSAYYNAGDAAKGQEVHQRAMQLDPQVMERNQRR
ncbi:MAG: tetratricopeptide repeat protein, partial [Saprospiraceae bacterium]